MSHESGVTQRFVTEAREHLGAMTSAMIAMERNEGGPQQFIEQLLRAAHSIKGGAGLTGLRNIERLAHAFESAVENLRDAKLDRTPEVIDTLLAAMDRIAVLVDDVDGSEMADIAEPLALLRALGSAGATTAMAPTVAAPEFEITERLRDAWPDQHGHMYGVKLDWWQCERQCGLPPLAVAERIGKAGTLLNSQTRPGGYGLRQGLPRPPYWFLGVVGSPKPLEEFTRELDIPCATVMLLEKVSAEKPPAAEAPVARSAPAPTSLRVSVPLVDRMMALAGELVLVRNQAIRSVDRGNSPMRRLMRRLDAVTNELQDAALRMRTQPVSTLFDRFPRVVRDLARQLGKQIEVRITGAEVELDKTILELLADPLTHLVRNCCDHGIELPDQRTRGGKPAGGHIDLSARQERGQIVIEIRDDGRGIDVEAIKRKALEHRVKTAAELERMADQQVFSLILLSGFSTAKQVTDLSGRGVGMDVVRTNLEQMGGVVEIDSVPGRGSIFTLRLPLTLAIMPCLLLGSDGRCFGVPQRDVEAVLHLGDSQSRLHIERDHEGEVLRWRGRLLPVVRLREMLKRRQMFDASALADVAEQYHAEGAPVTRGYAAVVRLGSRRFAMVFDEVLGSENIVVKPLHALLRPLGIYAATTILGDGQVALILSGEGVARHSGIIDRMVAEAVDGLRDATPQVAKEPLLLFRSGPDELLAVRMSAVRRVVPIAADRIERVGRCELVNVDGAATNVLRMDQFLSVSRSAEAKRYSLLLPRHGDSPVGLLASEIVDTSTFALDLDTRAYQADGVLGSLMIDGNIAILVDLDRIVAMWPQQLPNPGRPKLPTPGGGRILVVDDTRFFQKVVGEHLSGAGFDISTAENGREALTMLQQQPFDLVVSDIEMPVMDGHGLAKAVRSDPKLAAVPMVALTTLNTSESRTAATQSGFDAYEVKLDRQSLLATVSRLLTQAGRHIQRSEGGGDE
jgi:two-component system chemotaxis sensor kinase CheA